MANQPPKSKWHEIKQQSEAKNKLENKYDPVDTEEEIKQLYLNTQVGSPVDTLGEAKVQDKNPGPVDTPSEKKAAEHDEPDPDIPKPC